MITSKIIAASKHFHTNKSIVTYEITIPRIILSEFNKHRQLSNNSSSSRAVPISKNIEYVLNNTFIPTYWGANKQGMSADVEITIFKQKISKFLWYSLRNVSILFAKTYEMLGVHKQITNRLLELFTYQKLVVTATDWDNFFWLRNHKDAQPEFKKLAELMLKDYEKIIPEILYEGEWHTPYVDHIRDNNNELQYVVNGEIVDLETALKISTACCAQISYRNNDNSIEKANKIFTMLNLDNSDVDSRAHSVCAEHQATPIYNTTLQGKGITHMNKNGKLCSGNFEDWIQHRHLFKNESCKKYPYDKLNFSA
jgi:thymidylate synthase ThyX